VPTKPLRPCSVPLCSQRAVSGGRCAEHARQRSSEYSRTRYRSQDVPGWRTRIRPRFIAAHPYCEWPAGCAMPTEDVHHIDGDKSNVAEENLMALCHRHHSQVTTAMGQAWGKRARG
jgi:hypothetical protein